MAKVTSKLQLTLPKAIAQQYRIEPGVELTVLPAGDSIRLLPPGPNRANGDVRWKLRLFDAATRRQESRERGHRTERRNRPPTDRGWTRESLYDRGRTR